MMFLKALRRLLTTSMRLLHNYLKVLEMILTKRVTLEEQS